MAEPVYLTLERVSNDNPPSREQIEGDSTVTSLDRENTIECLAFEVEGHVPVSERAAIGRRRYKPLRVRKMIDRSTPLLARAFAENARVDGTFRFYRADPGGSGSTQQYFTVAITDARIVSIRLLAFDTFDPETTGHPQLDEVTFVFETITWTFTETGVEHSDTWTNVN
ncbi:MAG: type VI secretion system tube protein TssD [Mycobacteriales bacterium]